MTLQANLTNRDATRMPHPLVKWSYEPPRAEDVPRALGARDAPGDAAAEGARRSSRSRWTTGTPRSTTTRRRQRSSARSPAAPPPTPRRSPTSRGGSSEAENPVLVAGPDVDASGAWDAAVALAERQRLPVWAIPAPGGGRIGFPEGHPNFQGVLPPAIGPVAETLAGHDLILVVGSSVFPYYPNIPGPAAARGRRAGRDHLRPRRGGARADGRRDRRRRRSSRSRRCSTRSASPTATPREPLPEPPDEPPSRTRSRGTDGDARARAASSPTTGSSCSSRRRATLALRNQLRLSQARQLLLRRRRRARLRARRRGRRAARAARPPGRLRDRRGLASSTRSTAFWTAAAYDVPVTFLVLRNSEYAILKWFASIEQVEGAPGLDLPALDTAAIADGYGIASRRVERRDELRERAARGDRLADSPSWSRSGSRPGCGC